MPQNIDFRSLLTSLICLTPERYVELFTSQL